MKVIKMRPSHRPVIKAIINTFQPESVIECGCGPNSTPLWSEQCKEVVGVEHNQEWVDAIKNDCGDNVRFISHAFNGLVFSMYPEVVAPVKLMEIAEWYRQLVASKQVEKCDVLYVDSFAGTRYLSLIELASLAGIIMYHDTEYYKYQYSVFEKRLSELLPDGFRHFSYRPMCHGEIPTGARPDGFREIVRQEPSTDIIFRPMHYKNLELFSDELHRQHESYYWENAKYDFVEV